MGEGTCRRGGNLHAYPEGGRAASGWHKGGRSYGVSTTPLPKSALALPYRLTYLPTPPPFTPSSCPCICPALGVPTRNPRFYPPSIPLSCYSEQTLLGTQPVPRSYFEPLKAALPSCAQFPYEGENINAAYRVVETRWCTVRERERSPS